MPCEACRLAESNPYSGRYDDCKSCHARGLAKSKAYFDCVKAGEWSVDYRQRLERIFGDTEEAKQAGHRLVVDWAKRYRQHCERATA